MRRRCAAIAHGCARENPDIRACAPPRPDRGRDRAAARSYSRRTLRRLAISRRAPAFPDWVARRRLKEMLLDHGASVPRRRRLSFPTLRLIGEGKERLPDDLLRLLVIRPGDAQPFIKGLGALIVGV